MKQLTIRLENKPGQLASVCEALGKNGVNITSILGGGFNGSGIVHLVTSDPMTAERALRQAGHRVVSDDVILTRVADKPGELAKVARKLAFNNVNVEAIYLLNRDRGSAELVLKVNDPKAAEKALK
ncbi:ACT domain-containing protein [Candidatus Micrarchaeota archaeon]|nr:ACT domain-containing protein [Candidatus Micrarchaeota archaeon]